MATFILKQIQEIFLYIHKKLIKKIVMGFSAKHIEGSTPSQNNQPSFNHQLTAKEIEVILSMIKKTTFLGEDIEPLYNLIVKLQNQYLEQNK